MQDDQMTAGDINARAIVAVEFNMVWERAAPGNKPQRSIAMHWFRQGRDHGLAARAAVERGIVSGLRARVAELEALEVTGLSRRVRRLTEALAELEYCARQMRQAGRSGNQLRKEAVRIDAAIHNARKELR